MLIGSTIFRSSPVSRSSSQRAVRGLNRCPLNDTVPAGRCRGEGEPASVRGGLGGERAAAGAPPGRGAEGGAAGDVQDMPAPDVGPAELVGAAQGVAVAAAFDIVVVDVPPVGGDRRPVCPTVAHQPHPLAPVPVVHPQAQAVLAHPASGDRVPPHHDELAVRGPRRGDRAGSQIVEDRPSIRPVRIHDPQVVLPPAVRDEGDAAAVRGDARVVVERHPALCVSDSAAPPSAGTR